MIAVRWEAPVDEEQRFVLFWRDNGRAVVRCNYETMRRAFTKAAGVRPIRVVAYRTAQEAKARLEAEACRK